MGAVAEGGRRLTNPLYSSLFNIYKKWDYKTHLHWLISR